MPEQIPLNIIELRNSGSLLYLLGDFDQGDVLCGRKIR
jgi:hypothetical protein